MTCIVAVSRVLHTTIIANTQMSSHAFPYTHQKASLQTIGVYLDICAQYWSRLISIGILIFLAENTYRVAANLNM